MVKVIDIRMRDEPAERQVVYEFTLKSGEFVKIPISDELLETAILPTLVMHMQEYFYFLLERGDYVKE